MRPSASKDRCDYSSSSLSSYAAAFLSFLLFTRLEGTNAFVTSSAPHSILGRCARSRSSNDARRRNAAAVFRFDNKKGRNDSLDRHTFMWERRGAAGLVFSQLRSDVNEEERSIDKNIDGRIVIKDDIDYNFNEDIDQSLGKLISMPIVEVLLAVLVLFSSLLVGLSTLQNIPFPVASVIKDGELIISFIFTVEYLIRWKINGFSAKYVVQPLAIIDLIAILPGLIKFAALLGNFAVPETAGDALINLRLLRILRLQRVLTDYETFRKFELALGFIPPSDVRPYQLQLARVVISIFTLLSVTSGLIYSVEHVANPDIPDYFTAFYFVVVTLSTVGFGEIHPVTTAGRWVISGSILIASAVVPAQAAVLIDALFNRERERTEKETVDAAAIKGDTSEDSASKGVGDAERLADILARMETLEQKVDETNMFINRLLAVLESKLR